MQTIAALGGGAFVLASFVTGLRLLLMARRSRQLPELLLGLGLFLMGGVGYPLVMLAQFGSFIPDAGRVALFVGNERCMLVGLSALAVFTCRVFRPGVGVARTAVFVTASGLFGLVVYRAVTGGMLPSTMGGPSSFVLKPLITCLSLGWAGTELWPYYRLLRKRLRIGLAEPVVTERLRLWAIGILCAMLLSAISAVCLLLGIPFTKSVIGILITGIMGSLSAGCVWFAFFPPSFYLRWIESHAPARAEAS